MLNSKRLWAAILICALAAALPGLAGAEEPIVFKMGFVDPETAFFVIGGKKVAEEVEKATNGRIKIEVYASAQLGSERDMVEGAQIGTIDIATAANSVMSSFIPEMLVLDQPFLFDSYEQARHVIDGKLNDLIVEKAKAKKLHVVGWIETGFRCTFSKRPIASLADFKGLKIRTMENKMQIATFNALGAIATPMASNEQFTALQQGTIDANENALANMKTNRYYEIIKNVAYTNHLYTFIGIIMSDKAYKRIPADLMPQFLEGIRNGTTWEHEFMIKSNRESVEELSKNEGVVYREIDRDALKAAIQPAMEPFVKNMNPDWIKVIEEAKKEVK